MLTINSISISTVLSSLLILITQFSVSQSASIFRDKRSLEADYDSINDLYPTSPNEILPIQPILIFPKLKTPKSLNFDGRSSNSALDDDKVIYVKLLKRKSYRPKKERGDDENALVPSRELTMKDIFYVKALANGQFSHRRLKVYRLPEFFAISVYKKGDKF